MTHSLKSYFTKVCRHYGVDGETRRMAWQSALADRKRAYRIYKMIARSL